MQKTSSMPDQIKAIVTNSTPTNGLVAAMDKETANAMRAFIAKIARRYDLAGAILFGSRTRKTHRPDVMPMWLCYWTVAPAVCSTKLAMDVIWPMTCFWKWVSASNHYRYGRKNGNILRRIRIRAAPLHCSRTNLVMKVQELLEKATQAAASARLLLESGDMDGACNRAYYAMFDAARAVLLASEAPVGPEVARTHSGLI